MAGSETLRGLIALVASAGGRVDTRIRIQKEAFLLAVCNAGGFDIDSFNYHHYGPYSREISDVLQFAVSSDLLQEHKEQGAGDGIKYSYAVTNYGKEYLREAGQPNQIELWLVKMMNSYHWRALELAATTRFIELNSENLDRVNAINEALELKPDTRPHEGQASELLDKLDRECLARTL